MTSRTPGWARASPSKRLRPDGPPEKPGTEPRVNRLALMASLTTDPGHDLAPPPVSRRASSMGQVGWPGVWWYW